MYIVHVQGLLGLSAGEKLLKKVLLDVQLFKEQVQDRVVALLLLEMLEGPVRDQVIRISIAPKLLVGSITQLSTSELASGGIWILLYHLLKGAVTLISLTQNRRGWIFLEKDLDKNCASMEQVMPIARWKRVQT